MKPIVDKIIKFNEKFQQKSTEQIYIPKSFEIPVLKHILINNFIEKKSNFSPSLLLGIQGGYGMGKTFMVKELCKRYKIELIQISASELSGNVEAASRDKLNKIYEEACIQKAKKKEYVAILIDDFHLSIATEDDVGKTVNSNLLTSFIMNICDNPWRGNYRIPIILTGNNFTRLYGALVRVGRMDLLPWEPNIDEKGEIIKKIFFSRFHNIDFEVIEELINMYPKNSIAFFAQVAEDILLVSLEDVVERFRNSKGEASNSELRDLLSTSLKKMYLNEEVFFKIAKKRNESVLHNYETRYSNPNQTSIR